MLFASFLLSTFLLTSTLTDSSQQSSKQKIETYQARNFSSLYQINGFSKEALDLHFSLYQGYVTNTNLLIATLYKLTQHGNDRSQEYGALKRRLSWEFNGMRLHEYYFENLGGNGIPDPKSALYKQIAQDFSNFSKWKSNFMATGVMRGIGWVILYYDTQLDRLFTTWVDDYNTGNLAGCYPIIVLDVWEHAYITQFGLDRMTYMHIFFQNLDWKVANQRFEEAKTPNNNMPFMENRS